MQWFKTTGKPARMKKPAICTVLLLIPAVFSHLSAQPESAGEIVRKADEKFNGEKSGYSVMSMTVVRPSWQRTIEFKSWSVEEKYALTLITAPAREKGQSFLKRGTEMWSWNPTISRLIKLPPSMMSQGWMGSDYTNDDILRESSVVSDYSHTILGEEVTESYPCFRIGLEAREESDVLWSRQIWWVDKKEYIILKAELYDEDGQLVRTEKASELKMMDGRLLPSRIELLPADHPGNKTILEIREMKFNIPLQESFFSQQNMKTIK
jgi:outer membrane lipoprotein-sorting protein